MRPTGIVDPEVEVRETRNQIDDLMNEVRQRVDKRRARARHDADEEDVRGPHRLPARDGLQGPLPALARSTRSSASRSSATCGSGEYDVLVGVNLLREGLDLPEVTLVAILDADKEGFLRGETSLIQTIGRAARNVDGKVLMYADKETAAMRAAIARPTGAARSSSPTTRSTASRRSRSSRASPTSRSSCRATRKVPKQAQALAARGEGRRSRRPRELERTIVELEEEMLAAAEDLRFEYAAQLRDESAGAAAPAGGARPGRGADARAGLTRGAGRGSRLVRRASRRDLPWRRTTDPYAILVSEVMLQQTQAARVVPLYEACWGGSRRRRRWPARRRPTCSPCGAGSGYNRRALALQAAARHVARARLAAGRAPGCARCRASGRTRRRRSRALRSASTSRPSTRTCGG